MIHPDKIPRLLLTMGEPAGIGPEILVRAAQLNFAAEIVVLADPKLLQSVAQEMGLPLTLDSIDWRSSPMEHQKSHLKIEAVKLPDNVIAGQLNQSNSPAVLTMLHRAAGLGLSGAVDAIVTAPVHKAILNQADPRFLGHTEFFATLAGIDKVVMMLATEQLRVALATTHIPLCDVPQAIDQRLIETTVQIIDASFAQLGLTRPKIAVCGLNPHAGEDGLLGTEDASTVTPAIEKLRQSGIQVEGPFPSDSLFTPYKRKQYDLFLAMYHDQGLPVVKAIGFGQCANVTLGLPYIRTSVDHGTAIDISAKRIASSDSLEYAINYAIQLANGSLPR